MTTPAVNDVTRDQFLQLLSAQMRNQNPLDPVGDTEFLAQLAQFSTLEGIQNLNASFAELLKLQQLTEGANLVGLKVLYTRSGSDTVLQGVVDQVNVVDGKLNLIVNGQNVSLDQVRGLAR
jgi:flagellar basal-body rod modification protein FlgD